ncbi:MAG: hypothetical protein JW772_01095 [Candidatus Diapherotrites archaeon]|nr:hypothetical protein [Candidatus Diapherotrites archaeon]
MIGLAKKIWKNPATKRGRKALRRSMNRMARDVRRAKDKRKVASKSYMRNKTTSQKQAMREMKGN